MDERQIVKAVKLTDESKIPSDFDNGNKIAAVRPILKYEYFKGDDDPYRKPWALTVECDDDLSDSSFGTDSAPKDKSVRLMVTGVVTAKVKMHDEKEKWAVPVVDGEGKLESTAKATRCEILSVSNFQKDKDCWCVVSILGGDFGDGGGKLCVLAESVDKGPVLMRPIQVFDDGSFTASGDEYMSGYILNRY